MISIRTKTALDAVVDIPGSKSITHRALIAAAMAGGESTLSGALSCEDTRLTARALKQMGARILWEGDTIRVLGTGGRIEPPSDGRGLFLGNSGTSFRLLLSTVALGCGRFTLSGTRRMCERPVGELARALQEMGARIRFPHRPGYPPVTLHARGLSGGRVSVGAKTSSQYISSLLLAAPYAKQDTEIHVQGEAVSRPYVDLTVRVMNAFGVDVDCPGGSRFRVPAGFPYLPGARRIEGDASTASYFWAAAAVTGGRVVTRNLLPLQTAQGDIRFLEILERMGCRIRRQPDRVEVQGGPLQGVSVDMGDLPDMVPTLAAVGLFARGRTRIRNVAHLRYKESDRLNAIAGEWRRLGACVEIEEDGLVIHGESRLRGKDMDSKSDHRIAMSLAVAGLRVPGIRIRNPACVDKSFPAFWSFWNAL
ncbi:MAG: 3-phosphoshikimate 1-carboxyvinyltransferase [Desulfobacteraceae bacterium]